MTHLEELLNEPDYILSSLDPKTIITCALENGYREINKITHGAILRQKQLATFYGNCNESEADVIIRRHKTIGDDLFLIKDIKIDKIHELSNKIYNDELVRVYDRKRVRSNLKSSLVSLASVTGGIMVGTVLNHYLSNSGGVEGQVGGVIGSVMCGMMGGTLAGINLSHMSNNYSNLRSRMEKILNSFISSLKDEKIRVYDTAEEIIKNL